MILCPHCAERDEKIAYLEDELGLRLDAADLHALNQVFSLGGNEGRLVLALYKANSLPVTIAQLDEMAPARDHTADRESDNAIRVYIRRVRRKLGDAAIQTVHGAGAYVLSPEAAGRIEEALRAVRRFRELCADLRRVA